MDQANSPLFSARAARASGDDEDTAEAIEQAYANRPIDIDYGNKRFLVIDAVQEMRSAMNATLSTFGVTKIEYAHRAMEAIGIIKRGNHDVILCDFDLGNGYDGLHLLEELKLRNLLRPSAVFMIVTGERRSRLVISAAELAPDGYLLKPFTGEELKQRLDRAYNKKSAFEDLDTAIMNEDYFKALADCNERIANKDPFLLDFLKLKGRIALTIGDFALARETYQNVIDAREIPWAKMGMAKALFHLKDYATAKQLFEALLAENNRIMEAYDWLAKIHQAEHEPIEAQGMLQRAVDLSAANVSRQKKLGEVAMRNGDYATAVQSFQKTINVAKFSFWRDAADYSALAKAHIGNNEVGEAAKVAADVRREFRYDPKADMLATVMETQIALKQGNENRAQQLLNKAKQQFADVANDLPDHFALELAEACYRLDEDAAGGEIVQKVLRNHHEDAAILEKVSTLYAAVDRADLGQTMIEETARAIVGINNDAVRMAQSGDIQGAVQKFIEAVEEMPANVQVMLNAVNAMLAYVSRNGWHQEYMETAQLYLDRVKSLEPASVKYLKLRDAYNTSRRRFRT
ncbi:tetratricopeptide repeat-containing response regulator [Chitinimonas sp. BJB300]|uniref:tetratricopeptide repeat-containing response regulator n=1 Tax=Chitinimonas sp. BJB300 TaxID=1559339 RepID=UPI000C0FD1E3|nr:tetratricopeptide repeat-containing response regulator [Chitinimonas sp. BJB300]PHV12631.1 response regulator [Chitinimonas sp. BJB300]TSJ91165.1 response regulator [Chitinimonas sp. BJB300]